MRPVLAAVCHRLIVVSNCRPGSAHSHAALAIWRNRSRALTVASDHRRGDRPQVPVGVVEHRRHELVGEPHRVVGVLILDRVAVAAVEVHVEPGVPQGPGLALLDRLAPDEVLDVGVVGVEDDHLGRPPGLATALDRPGRGVRPAHEAHRTRRRPAPVEVLLGRTDPREVDPRARAALEDRPLLLVPVEDGVHGVLDGQDETGRRLLLHAGDTDVEPHRGVERRPLMDDEVLELVPEGLGLVGVDEVAVLDPPAGDGVGHPVGHLLERVLAARGAQLPPEVLLGEDVGGVLAPERRAPRTSGCSKATDPSRKFVIRASRRSQLTCSYGCTPAVVKWRRIPMPIRSGAMAMWCWGPPAWSGWIALR